MLIVKPNQEELERIKQEGREVYLLPFNSEAAGVDVEVIVTPPTRAQYKRFLAAGMDEKKRPSAMENLALECVVWPERKRLDELLDKRPGLTMSIGEKVIELAGTFEEVQARKL